MDKWDSGCPNNVISRTVVPEFIVRDLFPREHLQPASALNGQTLFLAERAQDLSETRRARSHVYSISALLPHTVKVDGQCLLDAKTCM